MIILLIGLLAWTPARSIDAVAIDDTLFIAMDRGGGDTYLFRYESSSFIREVSLGDYDNLSIGYFTGADTPCLIVVTGNNQSDYDDLIRRFDSEDLSLVWESDSVPVFDDWEDFMRLVFIERRSIEARQPRIVSYYCSHVTNASDYLAIESSSFDPEIYFGCYDSLQYYHSESGYIDDDFFGPVAISGSVPLTITSNKWWGMWEDYVIRAQVHEADSPGWMRNFSVHDEMVSSVLPGLPCGFCLGSNSTEAVFLWADSEGANWSTVFSGDPLELTGTYPFEYPLVGFMGSWGPAAAAASANPDDQGMLVCYYRDGYIRARYREEGSWNPYEHQISSSGWVYTRDLAVCSVTEGYWITWNDGGDYPRISFINRETLTAINGEPSQNLDPIYLTASPNPFVSSVSFTISGEVDLENTIVSIYDLTGHLIRDFSSCRGESILWDGQSSDRIECPSGTYIALVRSGESSGSCRLVLIR
ncbi:MAG: T9SS type A sorting domain-containing protein [Candidatus Aegiribacteria sp.]|nr:T9SS type A sorting domain-containing protein [Candidatus Aegiribacteria sp.]